MIRSVLTVRSFFPRLEFLANLPRFSRIYSTALPNFRKPQVLDASLFSESAQSLRNIALRSVMLSAEERTKKFDNLWKSMLEDPNLDITVVNGYLLSRLDCGLTIDYKRVFEDLSSKGLNADRRTYAPFILQCCIKGDMLGARSVLQDLKTANLDADSLIFSCILQGYLIAGYPEEVEATKEVMEKFGMWPSRSGYLGLLSGYARLGDSAQFLNTLKEADAAFITTGHSVPNLNPHALVKLYVILMSNIEDSKDVCVEVLKHLPEPLSSTTISVARAGVLQLLQNRRPIAARELFKHSNPTFLSELFLVSVGQCLAKSGESDKQLLSEFFKLANISDPRANMLLRRIDVSRKFEQRTDPQLSVEDKTVDELFDCASKSDAFTLKHAIVPRLLHLGVSPANIVDSIQPRSLAPFAAMACVLARLTNNASNVATVFNLTEAKALSEEFLRLGHLPHTDNLQPSITRSYQLVRNLIHTVRTTKADPRTVVSDLLLLFQNCNGASCVKPVITRMIGHFYDIAATRSGNKLDDVEVLIVKALADVCASQGIRFYENNWVLSALEQLNVPKGEIVKLRMIPFASNKVDVMLDKLNDMTPRQTTKA